MKPCNTCKIPKELSEYHKHPKMRDGHLNKCKECVRLFMKKNRIKNKDHYAAYDKKRANDPNRKKQLRDSWKKFSQTEKGRISALKGANKSQSKHPNANKSRKILNNAIAAGKIIRPEDCSECPSTKNIQGHHDNYNKPLDIRWLCTTCHIKWHKTNTPLNRK